MKKILKITILFIFCLILFSIGKTVEANSISSISMEIYVDENGNAKITETWKCNTNQGTEVYHPYYNLGLFLTYQMKQLDIQIDNNKFFC